MDRLRGMLKPAVTISIILILGLIFFAHNTHLQLATDDIGWLKGQVPTVYDQYRVIPRLVFNFLYRTIGPNVIAILTMIGLFHSFNSILIFSLAKKIFSDSVAAGVASCIFMINPITLSTLTWISCFSYVLGTTFALFSLLLVWKGKNSPKRWTWWIGAIACYGAGLFCSHEILFLPVLFFLLSWLLGGVELKPSGLLFGIAMVLGLMVNFLFYRFDRYGIETTRLFSLGFASSFMSSALAFGLSLGLAYPLSFFMSPIPFLQFVFSEPIRWGLTLAILAAGVILYKPNKQSRIWLVLILSFISLITPYIIRFYLMPAGINYDISYVLSGRVFYSPFIILAFMGGILAATAYRKKHLYGLVLMFAYLGAYLYAFLFLYGPQDFMGLSVSHGANQYSPLPWNPFRGNQAVWLASLALVLIFAGIRIAINYGEQKR
jgi:hypothetical protein